MINVNYTIQTTMLSNVGNVKQSISAKDPQSVTLSGSKIVDLNATITGSVFTSLMTGSISDYRYLYLYNTHTASVSGSWYAIIVQSSSVASTVAVLGPRDSVMFSPSQSVNYYAKASGSGASNLILRVAGCER